MRPLFGITLLSAAALIAHPTVGNAAENRHKAAAGSVGIAVDINGRHHRRDSLALGIHLSRYPDLVVIPGMPVLYDPRLSANYFFYEGSFWVFEEDDWYRSDWYNGPWIRMERDEVPVFLLRIPVRYFNRPPLYFHPWAMDMAPRWALRWGKGWERRHRGWDRWDTRRPPPPAPPPVFQQQFPHERYPMSPELQQRLREQHYRYRPREQLPPVSPAPPPPPQMHTPQMEHPHPEDDGKRRHERPPEPPRNPGA